MDFSQTSRGRRKSFPRSGLQRWCSKSRLTAIHQPKVVQERRLSAVTSREDLEELTRLRGHPSAGTVCIDSELLDRSQENLQRRLEQRHTPSQRRRLSSYVHCR